MFKLIFLSLLVARTVHGSPYPESLEIQRRQGGYQTTRMTISFYGWPDNNDFSCTSGCSMSPSPGTTAISGQCGRSNAGGSGTYDDPITAATHPDNSYIGQCEKFFLPYVNRWFINEDLCPSCNVESPHIDIWVGGTGTGDCPGICDCENSLTPAETGNNGWGQTCVYTKPTGDMISNYPGGGGGLYNGGSCQSGASYWSSSNPNWGFEICGAQNGP